MKWIKATVETNTIGADILCEQFRILGAAGAEVVDSADIPSFEQALSQFELIDDSIKGPPKGVVFVRAWLGSDDSVAVLKEKLTLLPKQTGLELGSLRLSVDTVDDEAWKDKWKQDFGILHIGKNFVIKPSWENYEPKQGEIVIEIDPGLAFGTGLHETTSLCLELMEKYLFSDCNVLDIGTGSGILSIAAAKLGAKKVVAVDLDPLAVEAASNNVIDNGVQDKVSIIEGNLTDDVNGKFDIVFANILAEAILKLIPSMHSVLNEGLFISSGIVEEKKDKVIEALKNAGYQIIEVLIKNEWCAICAKKSADA
jgi:ribosomal protein L11 methyltransferase